MKRLVWIALTGLALLAGCGAGDPPEAQGGVDLREFWRGAP
ncbi:hypothetical protein [Pararhodobacter marinus]|nr:hypothetical protein [Pararhodobacter marinus]